MFVRLRSLIDALRWELTATALAGVVFGLFSQGMLLHQSQAPHFVHQAAGLLQGQLWIPGEPPNLNDWVLHEGRWYSSFPPFPALLMAPFVALHGLAFNDVFFTVCCAALNAGLFVHLLRRLRSEGHHARTDREILALVLCWAFGSVYFPSAIRGEVWFTAHVVGVGLTLAYILASLNAAHPLLAGLLLGLGAATRANLVYAFPLFVFELVRSERPESGSLRNILQALWRRREKLVLFGLGASAVLLTLFAMNHARFGRWSEFGHAMLYNNRVNAVVRQYGLFHPHFFPDNFRSAFLRLPTLDLHPLRIGFDGNGMSMLLTTPLLLMLAPAERRGTPAVGLAVTALSVALPGLFYMNNGWFQFGYRFSNDYLPYLFALIVMGRRPMGRLFWTLGLIGVAVCSWGAIVFGRH